MKHQTPPLLLHHPRAFRKHVRRLLPQRGALRSQPCQRSFQRRGSCGRRGSVRPQPLLLGGQVSQSGANLALLHVLSRPVRSEIRGRHQRGRKGGKLRGGMNSCG